MAASFSCPVCACGCWPFFLYVLSLLLFVSVFGVGCDSELDSDKRKAFSTGHRAMVTSCSGHHDRCDTPFLGV